MRFFRSPHRVEPVHGDEADALAQLYGRAWTAVASSVSPSFRESQTASSEEIAAWMRGGFELYRTVHDGRVVGVMRLSFPNGVCHIDRLAVEPDLWRRGHGRALLELALGRARRMGAVRLWAQTSANLDAAPALYRELGFREQSRWRARYWQEPVVLFERGS